MERIHEHEVDTSEPMVRSLLAAQCPQWRHLPARRVDATGTTNTLWRLTTGAGRPDLVVRLPRQVGADASIETELDLLPVLRTTPIANLVATPEIVHAGTATDDFSMTWSISAWINGDDLWTERRTAATDLGLAESVAELVHTLRTIESMPVEPRRTGQRGGPFGAVVARLRGWLDDPTWHATDLVDVAAIRRLADEAQEAEMEAGPPVFAHGDLLPGNLLVDGSGRLAAVLDWGGAGIGDPAEDLAPAWSIFDRSARATFRSALDLDDATWVRARTTELEHAVGGVLYYRPRRHPLGDVMAATLERILDDR